MPGDAYGRAKDPPHNPRALGFHVEVNDDVHGVQDATSQVPLDSSYYCSRAEWNRKYRETLSPKPVLWIPVPFFSSPMSKSLLRKGFAVGNLGLGFSSSWLWDKDSYISYLFGKWDGQEGKWVKEREEANVECATLQLLLWETGSSRSHSRHISELILPTGWESQGVHNITPASHLFWPTVEFAK